MQVLMKNKFDETKCSKCVYPIWKGAQMYWNPQSKKTRHKKCPFTRSVTKGRVRFVTGAQS